MYSSGSEGEKTADELASSDEEVDVVQRVAVRVEHKLTTRFGRTVKLMLNRGMQD